MNIKNQTFFGFFFVDCSKFFKEYLLTADTDGTQIGRKTFAISLDNDNVLLKFQSEQGRFLIYV